MKKLFRFTAVAAVAFTLCMAFPSCDLISGGDDDDQEQNGDDVQTPGVMEFEFAGRWEAYEWLDDDPYTSEEELELMQQQTCSVSIFGDIRHGRGDGVFDANLLTSEAYESSPAGNYEDGRTRTEWFFERETYSFRFTVEEYTEDDWYVLMLTFDDEKSREPLWQIKIDSNDRNKAEFWFDGYGHSRALMRRI